MQIKAKRDLLLIVVCIAALMANIAGYVFNLYKIHYFDEALHCFTLFAITLFAATALNGKVLVGHEQHAGMLFVAIALIGVGFGALWEVSEWAYDSLTPANSILGKDDTMTDLIVDTLGSAFAAAAHIALWRKSEIPTSPSK